MKLLLTLLLLTFSLSFSQKIIQENIDEFIGVDIFENCYYTKNKTLYKTNLSNSYANIAYGKPDVIDITNPLEILLLFKDFNKVIILDNRLNFINEFDIPFGTTLIANGSQNKIWYYNKINNVLGLFNYATRKTEVKSVLLKEPLIALKSNLNNAITITEAHRTVYNFLANSTDQKDRTSKKFPLSLNNKHFIKKDNLYVNQKKSNIILTDIQAFEVIHNKVFFLSHNTLQMIHIAKN